ncbi:MAG TPA: winged helix-turn-helix domain-containing protein [Xanthomonadales bacterium]|nr:winged helix-turn-helix domain-containing protein [Xanthomonadales bacterium]
MEKEFHIAAWRVDPQGNRVWRGDRSHHLEPRAMDLLVYFAQRPNEILSRDQIFRDVWKGANVGESALHTAISALRRTFDDDPRQPRIIETIPKRGYRLIATTTALGAAVAVLPFRDLSMTGDRGFPADGFSDLLISELGRVPGIRVIAWTSVSSFRNTQISIKEIAGKLGARYIVEGSVLRSGERVRVSARLIDPRDGTQLWANAFDRELEELLSMQRRVADDIASAVSSRIRPRRAPLLEPTGRSKALVAYTRGRFHWYKLSAEHLDRAEEYFEESIALDPSFGPAYAGVADVWGARGYWGMLPMQFVRDKVWAPLHRAEPISDKWGEIQVLMAAASFLFEKDWEATESHLRRAIRLNPNLAQAHHVYGLFAITLKRADAVDWIDTAARLDPLNPSIQLARALLAMSQNEDREALQYVQRVLELDSAHPPANRVRANLAWLLKDSSAPKYEARLWTDDGEITALFDADENRAFDSSVLLRIGKLLRSRSRNQYVQPLQLARTFSLGGDAETALDILEDAYEADDLMPIVFLQSDCAWHPLRSHPRFRKLLSEIGLPA